MFINKMSIWKIMLSRPLGLFMIILNKLNVQETHDIKKIKVFLLGTN